MLVLSKMDKNSYTTLAWSIRWTTSVKNARYIQYKDIRERWKVFRSDLRWIKRCIALNDIVDMLEQMSLIRDIPWVSKSIYLYQSKQIKPTLHN